MDQDWLRKIDYEHWVGVLADLDCQRDTSGEFSKRNCLHQIGQWMPLGIFVIADVCGKAQSSVGSTTARQVPLGCIENVTEPTVGSKPVRTVPPYSPLQLLPPDSCLDFPQ